jgi:tetratricopeptide (TPR) repeat protein
MTQEWNEEDILSLKRLLKRLLEENELDQAKVVAKQLSGLLPEDSELWYFLGCITARLGDPKAAEGYLGKSLELGGDKFLISVQRSFICRMRGELGEAITWCRRGLELKPADTSLHHELADLYAHSGEPERSVEILEDLLRMPSLEPEEALSTREELGRLYLSIRQLDNAISNFQAALSLDDTKETIWANLGHCLSRKGDYNQALAAFHHAVDLRPDTQNLYNLGDAFLALDEPKKAIPPLLLALRQNPDHALTHYDLSLAYFSMGRYKEGAGEARAALRNDPEMRTGQINLGVSATGNLGLCLMNQERYEEALCCFKRNEEVFASTNFNMGLTLFRMERYKEALKLFKRALDIKPEDPEYLNLFGQTSTELGNYKMAEKCLRRSLELDPEYADSYYDLGNLFLRLKGRRKEAQRYLERAIELNPDDEWSYYRLACYYALGNKKARALEYLQKSLEKGLRNKDWVEADHDLDNLRADTRFKKLMMKYLAKEASLEKESRSHKRVA